MIQDFLSWEKTIRPEIEKVSSLLAEKLDIEPMAIIEQIVEVEGWNSRMGALLAQANNWMDRARLFYLPDRTDRTELDRKVLLDSQLAPLREVRDTIEYYCDSIKQKLILAESILSYYKSQYADHKPMEKPF